MMTLTIDPEFHRLCPPLSDDEYAQLEANLLAEGCREPLIVWEHEAILLDGHNRHAICQAHGVAFTVSPLSLPSREDAINWIINNQLGRRNLTPEQKSYLRGKRYNEARKAEGRPEKLYQNDQVSSTRKHLAAEYHVGEATIARDGQFATAVDTLDEQVRADIRETVLQRHERGKQQATKKQITRVGKLIADDIVAPLPFMQRPGWKPSQVLHAIEILGTFPAEEHPVLNTWLDRPFLPAEEGVNILTNLQTHTPAQRQHIYVLAQSPDPRDQSLATTLAAAKAPEPDPQVLLAGQLIKAVEAVREQQRRNWRVPHAVPPQHHAANLLSCCSLLIA